MSMCPFLLQLVTFMLILEQFASRSCLNRDHHQGLVLQGLIILFEPRETLPTEIYREAQLLGLTDAEFVKRLIMVGLERLDAGEPAEPGQTLDDFLVRNGALYQRSRALDVLLLLRNDVIDNGVISVNCHVQSWLLSDLQQLILRRVQHRLAQRVIHDR